MKLLLQWIKIKWLVNRDLLRLYRRLFLLLLLVASLALFAGVLASQVSPLFRWLIGLLYALIFCQVVCQYFLHVLRIEYMRLPKPGGFGPSRGVPSSLVGGFESLIFSVAVGAFYEEPQALAGVFAVMGLWLAAKMLAGWNRDISPIMVGNSPTERQQKFEEHARGAFAALLAGVLNLVVATVGGTIAAGALVFNEAADWIILRMAWLLRVSGFLDFLNG